MDTVRAAIAANIKRFRNERMLSVDEVGAFVGKSGKTVSAWEVGRGQPDADTLVCLCKLFGVEIGDFYGTPSEADMEIASLLKSMNDTGREALVAVARALAETFPAD